MVLDPREIPNLPPGGNNGTWYSDAKTQGLSLVCFRKAKTFVVRVRLSNGRRRTITLGQWGEITLEEARRRAKVKLGKASDGIDPVAESEKGKGLPTWRKWTETYLSRAEKTLRPASVADVRRYLGRTLSKWGARKLDEITSADVASLRDKQKGVAAPNRFRSAVSACLAEAVRDGFLEVNPASRVSPLAEPEARERMPSDEEMGRLLTAVDAEVDECTRLLFWMVILTGMRGSEARLMKWEDVDLVRGTMTIPKAKSGRREDVPLTDSLVEMLKGLPHRGPYVFPGHRKTVKKGEAEPAGGGWKPRYDLQHPWDRVLRRAGLEDSGLTLHTVRRRASDDLSNLYGTKHSAAILRHDERVAQKHYSPSNAVGNRPRLEARERDLLARVGRAAKGKTKAKA